MTGFIIKDGSVYLFRGDRQVATLTVEMMDEIAKMSDCWKEITDMWKAARNIMEDM